MKGLDKGLRMELRMEEGHMTQEEGLKTGSVEWWFEHTKSERAARMIELYWNPAPNGDKGLLLFLFGANPKSQVKYLKRTCAKLGYRMFWRERSVDGERWILAWVSPIPNAPVLIKPPAAPKKPKTSTVDNRTEPR